MSRHIIIGDVHGNYLGVKRLLIAINYIPNKDYLIFIGDYNDHKPIKDYSTKKTIDLLIQLKFESNKVFFVLGNHDLWFREWLNNKGKPNPIWLKQGADETFKSYGIFNINNAEDKYIQFACSGKLNQFYKYALKERKDLHYPPYSRVIKISATGQNKILISNKLKIIYNKLLRYKGIVLLGPTECPIEKINRLYRMHLILKTKKNEWLKLFQFIINDIGLNQFEKTNKNSKIAIDVDPISFL